MSATTILFDPEAKRAVLVHGGRAIGYAFQPLTEGDVHLDARQAAEWFRFGLAVQGVDPSTLDRKEFLRARLAAYKLMSQASRAATMMHVEAPQDLAKVFEAVFRGHGRTYMAAVASIVSEKQIPAPEAVAQLNCRLEHWSWAIEPARADVLCGIEPETPPAQRPNL